MHTLRTLGLAVLALAGTPCLPAQQTETPMDLTDSTSAPAAAPAPQPAYSPLTLGQKYTYSLAQTFSFTHMTFMSLRAGLDQAEKTPGAWGMGADAYSVRLASHIGRSLVREQLAFGVRALDHEDPRYFRLGQGSTWARAKYAIVRTFIVRNDRGGMMPAYSRFVASYGMPFIARQWRPEPIHTLPDGLRAGSVGIGVGIASNIGQEFLPDLKAVARRFHH